MPLNIPGILVPFQLLVYPRLVIPSLIVKDIRQLDFPALKRAGYRGAVFDKDNCLTIPYRDTLVPELQDAWKSCRETFGEDNILIVSNSAGTGLDAGGIQSESVRHHLNVPVLFHKSFKPAYSCISAIRTYFSSLRSPIQEHELIIVGDRVFTDVVMANRMRMQYDKRKRQFGQSPPPSEKAGSTEEENSASSLSAPAGPLAIWTTGVWERESMLMRWMERGLISTVERWSSPRGEPLDTRRFVKEPPPPVEPPKRKRSGVFDELVSRFRTS